MRPVGERALGIANDWCGRRWRLKTDALGASGNAAVIENEKVAPALLVASRRIGREDDALLHHVVGLESCSSRRRGVIYNVVA